MSRNLVGRLHFNPVPAPSETAEALREVKEVLERIASSIEDLIESNKDAIIVNKLKKYFDSME